MIYEHPSQTGSQESQESQKSLEDQAGTEAESTEEEAPGGAIVPTRPRTVSQEEISLMQQVATGIFGQEPEGNSLPAQGADRQPQYYEPTEDLLTRLLVLIRGPIRGWVRNAGLAIWHGQEHDVAEDLAQIAILKILRYLEHAWRYQIPIYTIERLCKVIAKNCFLDLKKREKCLLPLLENDVEFPRQDQIDPGQEAEEHLMETEMLILAARVIKTFPPKLREALLVDLARLSCFSQPPSTLQLALQQVGIDLHSYNRPRTESPSERNREIALRSLAYKRLAKEVTQRARGASELDAPGITRDAELAFLASKLNHTPALSLPQPTFKERLRARLLAFHTAPVQEVPPPEHGEPDIPAVIGDPELDQLAHLLRATAKPVPIDPAFKEMLRQKLLKLVSEHQSDKQIVKHE